MGIADKLFQQKKEKAAANLKAGQDFLEANKQKPGVVALPSGLQYESARCAMVVNFAWSMRAAAPLHRPRPGAVRVARVAAVRSSGARSSNNRVSATARIRSPSGKVRLPA